VYTWVNIKLVADAGQFSGYIRIISKMSMNQPL
jgi:hypothetical protein